MGEVTNSNSSPTQQKWLLAKMLLLKFGALGEFHVAQLEAYTYACSDISLESEFEINTDEKKVTYRIKTIHNYFKFDDEVKPRVKYSLTKLKTVFKYKKEVKLASKNLKSWTNKLLWEGETKVEVIIDGQQF